MFPKGKWRTNEHQLSVRFHFIASLSVQPLPHLQLWGCSTSPPCWLCSPLPPPTPTRGILKVIFSVWVEMWGNNFNVPLLAQSSNAVLIDNNNYNSLSSRFKTVSAVSAVSVEAFQKLNYKCTFNICMSVECKEQWRSCSLNIKTFCSGFNWR